MGPAAAFLKEKVGLPNPTIMRGMGNITFFWKTGIETIGLADFKAYDNAQVFVVNDNKVRIIARWIN